MPRARAAVLVSTPPGYALELGPDALDSRRLDELRLVAVERRAEARVAQGRPAAAVPDLERLLHDHPLREGAVRLLALALYRAGRQADALAGSERRRG